MAIFIGFQNGGRLPSWIFEIGIFLSHGVCRHVILLRHCWNRTISWWVMAKKTIFKMAAVRHL